MLPQNHNDHAIWFIIFILAVFFAGNFIFTQVEIAQVKNSLVGQVSPAPLATVFLVTQTSAAVATPVLVASPTPITKVVFVSPAPVQQISKITYIPLFGGSTQNTDWVNISGSAFTFNISDYGSNAYGGATRSPYVVWDANLRVDNASGGTFARIFDVTHGIAVNGSEINISQTSVSTDVVSGSLSFWAGNNSYVVQVKSLNGSTAFIDSGRIKVNY